MNDAQVDFMDGDNVLFSAAYADVAKARALADAVNKSVQRRIDSENLENCNIFDGVDASSLEGVYAVLLQPTEALTDEALEGISRIGEQLNVKFVVCPMPFETMTLEQLREAQAAIASLTEEADEG